MLWFKIFLLKSKNTKVLFFQKLIYMLLEIPMMGMGLISALKTRMEGVKQSNQNQSVPEKIEDIRDTMWSGILYSTHLASPTVFLELLIIVCIHSLCAHDVHHFFPSSSKMLYNIPMVNPDLSSSEPILFSPPDFDHTFNRSLIQLSLVGFWIFQTIFIVQSVLQREFKDNGSLSWSRECGGTFPWC